MSNDKPRKVKAFSVRSKEVFDKRKNPGLKLSVDAIIKNKKIKKYQYK